MKDSKGRLVVISVFSAFTNLFLFHEIGSMGTALILVSLWALTIGLFGSFKRIRQQSVESYLTLLFVFNLLLVFFVDSPIRMTIVILSSILSLIYASYILLRGYFPGGLLESVLAIPQVLGGYFQSSLELFSGSRSRQLLQIDFKNGENTPFTKSLAVGLLAGLPLAIWMTSLLTKADPVFASFVSKLVGKELLQEIPVRIFVTLFVFGFLVPTIRLRFHAPFVSPLQFLIHSRWGREMNVILTMIVILLGMFLIVQWPYVFVNVAEETSLSQFGVATYSEYVNKGFGELVKVAGIVMALSWIALLVHRGEGKGSSKELMTTLQTMLGIEFVVFILSIFRRVMLYAQFHGLSLARLYGLAFLIWLLGMGVTLLLRYFYRKGFVKYEIAWTLFALLVTLSINMQQLVVRNPPTVNERVDYVYLSRLTTDGYQGWQQSYDWSKNVLEIYKKEKGVLDANARLKIYYAGLVVDNLRSNYKDLAYVYGTGNEYDQIKGETSREKLAGMNRFLSWNGRRETTYEKLKSDIPYTQLTKLDDIHRELESRIAKQPEQERNFDIDISPFSPLI